MQNKIYRHLLWIYTNIAGMGLFVWLHSPAWGYPTGPGDAFILMY